MHLLRLRFFKALICFLPLLMLFGHAVASTISGTVYTSGLDVPHGPIQGATVLVTKGNGNQVVALAQTDALGRYSVPGLYGGTYSVNYIKVGYLLGVLRNYHLVDNTSVKVNANLTPILLGIQSGIGQYTILNINPFPVSYKWQVVKGKLITSGLGVAAPGTSILIVGMVQGALKLFVNNESVQPATITVVLPPATTGNLSGTVSSSQGGTLSGVAVIASSSNGLVATTTDSNGHYSFASLAPGTYSVAFSAAGYQTDQVSNVQVTAGNETILDATLQVLTGGLYGTVTDGSNPIGGAGVSVRNSNNVVVASGTTAADGTYTVNNLTPGQYSVTFSANGYVTHTEGPVSVSAGTNLLLNEALVAAVGRIVGTVKDNLAAAVEGASVTVSSGSTVVATTSTDASGNFICPNVPAGTYTVALQKPSYQSLQMTNVVVNVGQDTTINPVLVSLLGWVQGIVSDASSSAPVANAQVQVYNGSNALIGSASTDVNGYYKVSGLTLGPCSITASASGYQNSTVSSNVDQSSTYSNIGLTATPPPNSLTLTVVGAGLNNGLRPATIEVAFPGYDVTTTTDGYGVANFTGVPLTASYSTTVTVRDSFGNVLSSHTFASESGIIAGSNTASITLFTGNLSGSVVADFGAGGQVALGGAMVSVFDGNGNQVATAVTGAFGTYFISGLFPAAYTVKFGAPGYNQATDTFIDVVSQATNQANATLQPNPPVVSGTVTDSVTALPVQGATVSVGTLSATTDAQGKYALTVPGNGGVVTVNVTASGYAAGTASVNLQPGAVVNQDFALTPQ